MIDQVSSVEVEPPVHPQIRVIVLGLIKNGTRLLVASGYDEVKQAAFYRALGGGVEFGETSLDAIQREFQEEIQAELTQIQYLGCIENLFVLNGKPGHELVQLYQCDFADPRFYEVETILGQENSVPFAAHWIEADRFRSGELRLVPAACLAYL
jgi:8-oxo-dGTP pyrophosphatase MutT (NUDIX family)